MSIEEYSFGAPYTVARFQVLKALLLLLAYYAASVGKEFPTS